jgi:outer membrane lipoprotein carrier protein
MASRMRTWLIVGALALATTASGSAVAQSGPAAKAMPAQQVVARMQALYKSTSDFQAKFQQTYTDVAAGDAKKSVGRVYYKSEGKMRWDYYKLEGKKAAKRPHKKLVSDGNAFWIYEREFKQVFKQCLTDSKLPTSLRFLMGQGNLAKEFNITLTKNSTPALPELKLVPKVPTSQYKELRFVVDGETFQVLKTTIYDPYGNTNEIVFKDVKLNTNLPDKGFEFKQPKGARLLNPQKEC